MEASTRLQLRRFQTFGLRSGLSIPISAAQPAPEKAPSMSALGQKQTCAARKGMSALPPIATAKADFPQKSCPLYPRKRTHAVHNRMSALGQKRTYAGPQVRSEPLPSEQEIVECLGSWRHTFGLRTKNIGVGGQHFDIDCFVDALGDSRCYH